MPIPSSVRSRVPAARDAPIPLRRYHPFRRVTMTTVTMLTSQPAVLLRRVLISIALFGALGSQPARRDDADTTPHATRTEPAAPLTGHPQRYLPTHTLSNSNLPLSHQPY